MSLCNFVTNSNVICHICLQPDMVKTYHISKLIIRSNRIHCLKYLRSATFDCKVTEIRLSEFVAKTQFFSAIFFHILKKSLKGFKSWLIDQLKLHFLSFSFINQRSDFINQRSDFINQKTDFINQRSDFINQRSDFINQRSDYMSKNRSLTIMISWAMCLV